MGKKSVIISAGISVALFATVLTVSLVNNTRTNEKLDTNISDVKKDNETLKNETQASLKDLEGKLNSAKTALEAADKQLTEADAAMKSALEKSIEDAKATIKATTDALAAADTQTTKDLTDALKKIEKNITDITATNKSIEDAKTELNAAIETAKTETTKAINTLKTSTNNSLKELGDTLDEVIADYDTLNSNINKKLDTTSFNTFKETVETFKAEYVQTANTVATLKETVANMATTESVTALKTTVESLNTTVAAITETVNTTKTGLSALNELTSQHTANIDSLSEKVTAIASVVSDAARETKVSKVNALFDNYYTLRDKMEQGMNNVLAMGGSFKIDGEELTEAVKIKQLRNLEKALNTGLMNLALCDVTTLDATIDEANANLAAVAEKVNVVCEKAAFAGKFAAYKTEIIEKINALVELDTAAKGNLVDEVNNYNPVVDYDALESTAQLETKLAELKFNVYKIYVKGELADKKITAKKAVEALTVIVDSKFNAEYVTSVTNAIDAIEVVTEATTQGDYDVVKNNQYAVMDKLVELATNQNKEAALLEQYKSDLSTWVAAGNLSAEKQAEALAKYAEIVAKYDYAIGGLTHTNVVLNEEKTVADVTAVYTGEAEELAAARQVYADIEELDRKQKTADAEFTALKTKLEKVIDGTSTDTVVVDENVKFETATKYLNDAEKAHYKAMLAAITMKPASAMENLDEIRTEETRVHGLVSNVTNLALSYDNTLEKTVRVTGESTYEVATGVPATNALTVVSTGTFVTFFSSAEITAMKNEAAALASKWSFDVAGFEGLTDEEKANALAAIDGAKVASDTKAFNDAVVDFTTKYNYVLDGRKAKHDAIEHVNTEIDTILGDYVKNNYGMQFEKIETFTGSASETAEQVKTRLDEYKGRVNAITKEADSLANALQDKDAKVNTIKTSLVESGTYLDTAFVAGLSATEKDDLVKRIEAIGNATSLYIELQNGVEKPIEAYTAAVKVVYDEATTLHGVKVTAYNQDVALRESLTAFETHYKADFLGTATDLVPVGEKFAKFTDTQWTAYTNTIDGYYTTYRSYKDTGTTTENTNSNKAEFDAKFAEWEAKVIADYKTADNTFINDRWFEYGIDTSYNFTEVTYDRRVNPNSNIEVIYKKARDKYLAMGVNAVLLEMLATARTNLSKAVFSFEVYRNYVAEVETLATYMLSIDNTLSGDINAAKALIDTWLA
ncbi:MAG: hypothetical protein SOU19_06275 [Candidatus Caccosoma sp.]|nr:hypothetical protein [Candidatus Caccosoma sp.]